MNKYIYIVTDRIKNDHKQLSHHLTQKSAYYEVAKLSKIPYTMDNSNKIGSQGGWKSEFGDFFVLEKEITYNEFPFEDKAFR
ncbi:hypothetical protein [Psychrobacillus phage Perkons]|nr:hypothetical protein [Psychrobacillus phage Perkons]